MFLAENFTLLKPRNKFLVQFSVKRKETNLKCHSWETILPSICITLTVRKKQRSSKECAEWRNTERDLVCSSLCNHSASICLLPSVCPPLFSFRVEGEQGGKKKRKRVKLVFLFITTQRHCMLLSTRSARIYISRGQRSHDNQTC